MGTVGRYRIVRAIGRGGMAEVLEAIADGPDGFERRVAIKRMLPAHATDESFTRMFLDEARIASQLHHANIVGILDYGIVDGSPFQVLEYVDGADVRNLLRAIEQRGEHMPIEIALHIATDVGHALAHAHAATGESGERLGIVHRDLSPANVFVGWSGDVKLGDFGVAFAKDKAEKTLAGGAKGTLAYMSPEEAVGDTVDGRADVFGLGCLLHRMVAGRSPLGGSAGLVALMAGTELELDPELPDDVRAIVPRATLRRRETRWTGAEEMTTALGHALATRIDRDPKTVMREWLGLVRPRVATLPTRGKLDDLLAVDIVLSAVASGARRFEAQERVTPLDGRGGGTLATLEDKPRVDRPRRARRRAALATLIAVAVTGTTVVGVRLAARDLPSPSSSNVLATVAPPRDATPPPTAASVSTPTSVVTATRNTTSSPIVPIGRAPAGALGSDSGARPVGRLAVAGEHAVGARVLVDGQPIGYAPLARDLPLGVHTIELELKDGSHFGPQTVTLTVWHTPSNQLEVLVP